MGGKRRAKEEFLSCFSCPLQSGREESGAVRCMNSAKLTLPSPSHLMNERSPNRMPLADLPFCVKFVVSRTFVI